MNDKTNKYSAYHHFGTNPLLQNGLVLRAIRLFFGDSAAPSQVSDPHSSFNGVSTHENGLFLYQSKQANMALKWSYADVTSASLFALWAVFPSCNYLLLPFLVSTTFIPRRWVQQKYFTWHAELLPHTE